MSGRIGRSPGVVQHNGPMVNVARLLLSSLAGILALVSSASVAAACSCAEATTAEHVAWADVVARGVIERIAVPDEDGRNAGNPAVYTIRPTHVWKGDVVDTLTIETSPSGASCGLEFLSAGQDIVLFATKDGDSLTANLCGGTAPAEEVLVAEVTDVLGAGKPLDIAPSEEEETFCNCAEKSTAEHAADADLVARVIVERINMPVEGATDGQPATYTLRPTYVWKSDVISQFKVNSEPIGAACGLEGITEGQDIVVFAKKAEEAWSADLCGGTAPATTTLVAELLEVVGPGVAIDAVPGDRPGEWVWPTVTAVVAVALVVGVLAVWWYRPRRAI